MKIVFIRYNPYKLETEIRVDDAPLAKNSRLKALIRDSRLQDWTEELPDILLEDYNDRDFHILFQGMRSDFEDLKKAFDGASKKKKLAARLELKPAKSAAKQENLVRKLYKALWSDDCPFKELQTPQIKDAFEKAFSGDFEVCVVATMSAGKSTLINALLGRKLMPTKQEACTAIVTRIKEEERDGFRAEVYDKSGQLLEKIDRLTWEDAARLNEDERVFEIRAFGRIPFAAGAEGTRKKKIKLTIIDTPGPNNARNFDHKKKQREILESSSKDLVIYIMTGEFGTEDDAALLDYMAESMAVKGTRSDRLIFAINKLDLRGEEDGSMEETLEGVQDYLREHGIEKPKLFPIAALPALNIRLLKNASCKMNKADRRKIEADILKLNSYKELHLEKYAALPPGVKGDIEKELAKTCKNWQGKENADPHEALVHSGVVFLEAAINQYACKYARTAKVKNVADNIIQRIDELKSREESKLKDAKFKREIAERWKYFPQCFIHFRTTVIEILYSNMGFGSEKSFDIEKIIAMLYAIGWYRTPLEIEEEAEEEIAAAKQHMARLAYIRKEVEGMLEI